ncbi:MAG: flagellar basal body rod protein FlgC [bacterium]
MLKSISSALSGLIGFQRKFNSTAHNIANSNTDGYKTTRVTLEEGVPDGVKVTIHKTETLGPIVYEHTNEGEKLIEKSNVNLIGEITDMMLITRYYEAQVKTIQTADEMLGRTLDIIG